MSTITPIEYGYYYHIYNRGHNYQNIFFVEENYHLFLRRYTKYIVPIADTYAYCLLRNHFHFLIRVKLPDEQTNQGRVLNPTQQFSNFFNSYTKTINNRYHRVGTLFQGRFGRILVDSDSYFTHLIAYIHQNPQKHGFVDDFRDYPYSSYQAIVYQKKSRVKTDDVLSWFGGVEPFQQTHYHAVDERQIAHLIVDDLESALFA
jgi:REP element-mobilizing transposase RayT